MNNDLQDTFYEQSELGPFYWMKFPLLVWLSTMGLLIPDPTSRTDGDKLCGFWSGRLLVFLWSVNHREGGVSMCPGEISGMWEPYMACPHCSRAQLAFSAWKMRCTCTGP